MSLLAGFCQDLTEKTKTKFDSLNERMSLMLQMSESNCSIFMHVGDNFTNKKYPYGHDVKATPRNVYFDVQRTFEILKNISVVVTNY